MARWNGVMRGYIYRRRRGGGTRDGEGCRPRDVTVLTTPGTPQWPFLEGADALAPLSAPRSPLHVTFLTEYKELLTNLHLCADPRINDLKYF